VKKNNLLLLLLLPFTVIAQKSVDLDRFYFTVNYRSLPKMQIDKSYQTYHVNIESTKLMQSFLNDLEPAESIKLEGWKKLSRDGHIGIQVKLGDLLPESFSIKERTEIVKTKSGQVSGTRTFYCQEITYSFEANATISDYKGTHIMDEQLASRTFKQIYRSPEFAIKHVAEGYFLVNSLNITKDLYRRCVNKAMETLSQRITYNFGYNDVTVRDYMWIVGSRKHPEYAAHRQAYQTLTEAFFSMNANTPLDGTKEKVQQAIDYFEKIKSKYSSAKKHDRKIRYASFFNLAVLYYYLDDPQQMMKEANGLALNDFDAKDAKGFEQTATMLKNQFLQTNINTRHFKIDPSSYKGPYEKEDVTVK